MYKRWIAVIVPTLTLAIAATPAFASTAHSGTSRVPSGTYQATIKEPASLKGVWRIEFHAGTDTDFLNGTKVASGTYTISGTTITFAQPAAPSGSPDNVPEPRQVHLQAARQNAEVHQDQRPLQLGQK